MILASLKYVGPPPVSSRHLVSKRYVEDSLLGVNLSQPEIDTLVTAGFAAYATTDYVTSHDLPNATKAYIDAGDDTRLHLSQIGVDIAPLEGSGRTDIARVPVASTQRFPKPYWSPTSYHTSDTQVSGETTLYTTSVADPGFTYKLLVFGVVNAKENVDNGEAPLLLVRVGSTGGTIIANGAGTPESYNVGGTASASYTSPGSYNFSLPTNWTSCDVVGVGAGGGGDGGLNDGSSDGNGGRAGNWFGITLGAGTNTPVNATTVAIGVGSGGAGAGAGGHGGSGSGSSASVSGGPSGVVSGGSGGFIDAGYGGGVAAFNHNGNWYGGGSTQGSLGQSGHPPGGGGAGGRHGSAPSNSGFPFFTPIPGSGAGSGGSGAGGAVYVNAYAPVLGGDITTRGPVRVMPQPFSAQAPLTGAVTLYLRGSRSGGSSSPVFLTDMSALYVIPVPV